MKILMVCLGNICRSPLAEGLLKAKIEEKGLDWHIDSAGTGAWHIGEPPDPRSVEIAKANGIDITDQRARKFRGYDLEEFDLILAMDSSNFMSIMRQANDQEEKDKVKMILNFSHPDRNLNVPDPYYNDGFEQVFQMLDKACEDIIEFYLSNASKDS